ncbi:MAG TPA: anti-sigma factor [Chloroflexota bacterium]
MSEPAALTCDEFLDLAAAVALDAAEDNQSRLVAQHAEACPRCGAWLDVFREVAAVIGSAVPQLQPPEALRVRLLRAVRHEPRRPSIVRRLWPRAVRRRASGSAAWVVAAASLLVSLGAVAWVANLQTQIGELQRNAAVAGERAARYDHVVEVLASDRLAIRPLQPMAQNAPSRGMVYMDPASGTGMLMCRHLPPIEQGHVYQLWFVRGNERVSGGLLWPDHDGNGYTLIQVPRDLQSFDSIGLTDEPGTGSAWPTTPRVMGTPLEERSQ